MIMDGMTGIMQVVRVAIMIIYIWVKITITVFSDHKDEIIYWGKTGLLVLRRVFSSFGMKSCNLALLLDGEAMDYMKWYDAYDSFLKHNGFAKAFPTVDDLTRAMGNVAFYYQGRVIENILYQ